MEDSPCACLSADFDGGNEFYDEKTRKARKPHRCCECGKTIQSGERYHYAAGKFEGDLFTQKTCLLCDEIRRHFYCDGWTFCSLWDDIVEQLFSYSFRFECLQGLSVEAREMVLARWRSWKGLTA